jgi:acyl-CoA thioesterase-1
MDLATRVGSAVTIALYLLISGRVIFLGLTLVILGAGVALRFRRSGSALVWVGLVMALASAVAIPTAVYVGLVLSAVVWQSAAEFTGRRWTSAALGLVAILVGVMAADTSPSNPLPRRVPIVVLGDSLAAGLAESDAGTWPRLLSERLGVPVTNLARAGATLSDGARQAEGIPAGPDTVLVELGGNDLLGGRSPDQFETDLRRLLAEVSGTGRRVVMFELPLLPLQNRYGRIQRGVCSEHAVILLPRSMLAGAIALPGHASDGLHLSSRGHQWLAARVAERWSGR